MAIAAVIVLHRRAEKFNFIDIHGGKKDEKKEKKNPFWDQKKKRKRFEACRIKERK